MESKSLQVQQSASFLLISIVCGADSLNSNPIIPYLLHTVPLSTLLNTISNSDDTSHISSSGVMLSVAIGLLANYQKYEQPNQITAQFKLFIPHFSRLLLLIHSSLSDAISTYDDSILALQNTTIHNNNTAVHNTLNKASSYSIMTAWGYLNSFFKSSFPSSTETSVNLNPTLKQRKR